MLICLDIDDTITYAPHFFSRLTHCFHEAKIVVVTFRQDYERAALLLRELNVRFDQLIVSNDDQHGKTSDQSLHVWKSDLVNSLQPDLFFEDMPEVVARIDESICVIMPCDPTIRSWIANQVGA